MSNYLNHRAPKAHAPKWLQIIAIYAFAMSAAVACSGKFEVAKNEKKETANGTGVDDAEVVEIGDIGRRIALIGAGHEVLRNLGEEADDD